MSVLLHTAFCEEEKLPWSGMDLCNVKQNELVDGKDRFCIMDFILMTLSQNWVGVELGAKTRRDSNSS